MGEIFRATDQELGRDVAVKVLAERYAQDDGLRQRFKREALAAARLSGNPNMVTIFDVDEHNGRPFIVMEYLGAARSTSGRAGACPRSQVLRWLDDAAAALDAAHEAGRRPSRRQAGQPDPRRPTGNVHVADFGIASASGHGVVHAGRHGPRHRRVPVAGAGAGRAGRRRERPLRTRVVAWELLAGQAAVPGRLADRRGGRPRDGADPVVARGEPRRAGRRSTRSSSGRSRRSRATATRPRRSSSATCARALHEDAGDTWIERPPPATAATRLRRRRRLALVDPGARGAAGRGRHPRRGPLLAWRRRRRRRRPRPRTIVKTVTSQGTTVHQTVTATPPPPPRRQRPSTTRLERRERLGAERRGLREDPGGRPRGGAAAARAGGGEAVRHGRTTEAYAAYNLAYTRYRLGNCTEVVTLLDRSESIQGARKEIDRLRKAAREALLEAYSSERERRTAPRSTRLYSPDLIGSHQSRFSRYQSTVSSRPPRRTSAAAAQPRPLSLLESTEYRRSWPGRSCDVPDEVGARAGQVEDPADDVHVLALLPADVVDLACLALAQRELDPGAVILDVQPLAPLPAVAVHRQVLPVERVRDEERQELLRVLARAVGVRAARDQRVDAVGAHVREHLQVAAGLRRRVRARRRGSARPRCTARRRAGCRRTPRRSRPAGGGCRAAARGRAAPASRARR